MLVLFVQPLHPVVLHCTINQSINQQSPSRGCELKYKSKRYGFLPGNFQNACDIVETLETNLFRSVQILSMFCFAFSHLKRPPVIIYGNGLITSPFPK